MKSDKFWYIVLPIMGGEKWGGGVSTKEDDDEIDLSTI